jgi:Family of unknown function (DUF6185)
MDVFASHPRTLRAFALSRRARIAIAVLCLVLVAAARPAGSSAQDSEPPVEVVNRLAIDGSNPELITARASMVVTAPIDSTDARRFFQAELGRGDDPLRDLLRSGMGLFEVSRDEFIPHWVGSRLSDPPDVTVGERVFKSSSETDVVELDGAVVGGVGHWSLVEDGDEEEIPDGRLGVRIRSEFQGRAERWRVVLATRELPLAAMDPAPSRLQLRDGWIEAEWQVEPRAGAEVSALVRLPWQVGMARDVRRDTPFWLQTLLDLLVSGALVLIAWVYFRRQVPPVNRLLVALVALAGAAIIATESGSWAWLGRFASDVPALTGVVAGSLAPAVIAVIVGTVLFAHGRRGRSRWLVVAAGVSSVALLGAAVVLQAWEPLIDLDGSGLDYTYDDTWVAWLVALGALLGVALAAFVLVAGVIQVIRRPVGSVVRTIKPTPLRRWERSALLWSMPLAVALTVAVGLALVADDTGPDKWQSDVPRSALFAVESVAHGVANLIPVMLAPVLVAWLLRGPDDRDEATLFPRGRWLWLVVLLYLFYVVSPGSSILSVPAPVALLIAAIVLVLVLEAGRWSLGTLLARGRSASPDPERLASRQRELIDRVLLADWLTRRQHAEERRLTKGEPDPEFSGLRRGIDSLTTRHAFAVKGPSAVASRFAVPDGDRELVTIDLPGRPKLRRLALGLGPCPSWPENGRAALRVGAMVAVVPLGYLLFVAARDDVPFLWEPRFAGEGLRLISIALHAAVFWGVAAVVLGCLYARLPFGTGGLKGLCLALPYAIGNGLADLIPGVEGSADWVPRAVQLFAFLVVVGVWLDLRTINVRQLSWHRLGQLYQIRNFRAAAVNLAPLVLAALAIYQQLRAGNATGAVEEFARNAPAQLPSVDADGP